MKIIIERTTVVILSLFLFAATAAAQTTLFTFQNTLPNEITPATGKFEMEVRLFDAAAGGTQIGATNLISEVEVKTRVFTIWLDFGAAAFPGADRFIEVSVRRSGSNQPFTTLEPRKQILSVPYAIRALNATTADNALNLNGVDVNDFVLTTDGRLSDSRDPNPGSANYIQNTTTQQGLANFNIDGSGTAGGTLSANLVNSATQYNIGGQRVLTVAGTGNLFAGVGAGQANSGGSENSFFGRSAGLRNTTGIANSFFGRSAGANNTTGSENSFFGRDAGGNNISGSDNAFFGSLAGRSNTTGFNNSFFGRLAGESNTTGENNTFVGFKAGENNTTGNFNAFFGSLAGAVNTVGIRNAFFGTNSGIANTTGNDNSFFGTNTGFFNTTGLRNSFFGSLAGIGNTTGSDNSFFGMNAGFNNTTASGNSFFGTNAGLNNTTGSNNVFIGFNTGDTNTTGSSNTFVGHGSGTANTTGSGNSFFGDSAGAANTTALFNVFLGAQAGSINTTGGSNAFIGTFAGNSNTTGNNNTIIGTNADVVSGNLSFAAAIGAGATVNASNTIVLGRSSGSDTVFIPGNLNINGTFNGSLPAGSADYIQNRTTQQAASNFNISGSGTLGGTLTVNGSGTFGNTLTVGSNATVGGTVTGNIINAATQFNINGNQALTRNGLDLFNTTASFGYQQRVTDAGAWRMTNTNGDPLIVVTPTGNVVIGSFIAPSNSAFDVEGTIGLTSLAPSGITPLCYNGRIAQCSSSIRYKSNISEFRPGLSLIKQLRPVSFNWKQGGMLDLGLVAEEVSKIEPLLTTINDKGEIEGVKYDRIGVVLVNAVQQQQEQIEKQNTQIQQQQKQIEQQQFIIDSLKKLVCQTNQQAEICK